MQTHQSQKNVEIDKLKEEVWTLFREVAAQSKETDRKFQETDRKFQETDRKFQETDRKFQETDRKFQETDRKFQETDRKLHEGHQALREELRESSQTLRKELRESSQTLRKELSESSQTMRKELSELDRVVKETGRIVGNLGNRLGDFVQEMVRPAVVRLFQSWNIPVHEVHRNIYAERDGEAAELDLLMVNDSVGVSVECKSQLSLDDVNEHLERLDKIKRLLPKYADIRLMGAVAAMVIPESVARYAYRKGLFVLAQNGSAVEILNDARFQPKTW